MVSNYKMDMDAEIVLPNNTPIHFSIVNEREFQEAFAREVDPETENVWFDDAGDRVCTEIAQAVKNWIEKGACPLVFLLTYERENVVEFRFDRMSKDEYGNIYLEYDYVSTM